ncbi:MAG: cupin-like domain-containing protein [bacterium]|nr:cupin-like domain-containing protein [bacterium]
MKTIPVEVVKKISDREFDQFYLKPQKPVVLKGLTDETSAGKKWNIDYINHVCGDVMVDVYDNANPNSASAFTTPDLKMKFGDYVNTLLRDEPSTLRMFLFNMFAVRPALRKDFPCPSIIKGIMGRAGFMFFGAKGVNVRIHQDMDMSNVILTQFYGRKKVVLVSPNYSRLLYKLPYNTHSLVDLDHPDYEKYPGLRHVPTMECILEPGDSLFIPSGYWHYITYLESGFSVSYRKIAQTLDFQLLGFLSLCIYMPFDKMMNKLLGKIWLHTKEDLAVRRANRDLHKMRQHRRQLDLRDLLPH